MSAAKEKQYTLEQHAHAALELADHLAQVDRQGVVMLNTSACVGWLAIDLFMSGKDGRRVKLDTAREYLLERPAIHEEDGQLIFKANLGLIGKRSFRLNLIPKPRWINNSGRTCSAGYSSNLFEPPTRVALLYLLYQLAEAPINDLHRLYDTLTVVYIFSRLVHARRSAPDSHPGSTAVKLELDAATWAQRYAGPALRDPQHRERYERVLGMLQQRARREGPLRRAVLEEWAAAVASQPACPWGNSVERILVRMEAFLNDVAAMLLAPSGTALSLGKSLPAGMAVFHPDSARRRAFEGRN
ncbi:hypothetical protein JCM9279_000535 [Rhodotorula babjevae]